MRECAHVFTATEGFNFGDCRRIVEWVAFQFQRVSDLTTDSPVLFSYAEDLDANERGEVQRILEFLQIEDLHVVEETVTANVGFPQGFST